MSTPAPFYAIGSGLLLLGAAAAARWWSSRGMTGDHADGTGTKGSPLPLDAAKAPPAAMRVPARKTAPPRDEVELAIRRAWQRSRGTTLNDRGLRVLMAQYLHETGGGSSMWNYNPAGLKAPTSWRGSWTALRGFENEGGRQVYRMMAWRAFPSLQAGLDSWLGLLHRRYGTALDAAQQGDMAGFARGLKARGYFTADLGGYLAALARWA